MAGRLLFTGRKGCCSEGRFTSSSVGWKTLIPAHFSHFLGSVVQSRGFPADGARCPSANSQSSGSSCENLPLLRGYLMGILFSLKLYAQMILEAGWRELHRAHISKRPSERKGEAFLKAKMVFVQEISLVYPATVHS